MRGQIHLLIHSFFIHCFIFILHSLNRLIHSPPTYNTSKQAVKPTYSSILSLSIASYSFLIHRTDSFIHPFILYSLLLINSHSPHRLIHYLFILYSYVLIHSSYIDTSEREVNSAYSSIHPSLPNIHFNSPNQPFHHPTYNTSKREVKSTYSSIHPLFIASYSF